jgi:uncharacterized protein DUF6069
MTTTITTTTIPTTTSTDGDSIQTTPRPRLWRAGAAAAAAAAVATTAVVVAARAADIPVAVSGEEIPLAGFAQLTVFATIIGVVLGKVLSRRAARPRRTFTIATIALTAASLVPDLLVDATVGSRVALMATHVIAAAIVIPTLAKRVS